jgi:hypothetical protein
VREASTACHVRHAGDYVIAVGVDDAEGAWSRCSGELRWADPEDANCRIDVVVRDAADGRFVPELWMAVTLIDPSGAEVGAYRQPFVWHPEVYRYSRDWKVPRSGTYRVRVRVEPPTFVRADPERGRRYLDSVEVEFDRVRIDLRPRTRRAGFASLRVP